ncbi:hypothetical protein [Archaeoglobus neptunius]|uniref:hypothetical protein n=1 Tax=Archaeoglobus neptunius TaxID=2798580 RepID=UPI0019274093|nr:hypothetical protein [Archaeoglobus neptunius]
MILDSLKEGLKGGDGEGRICLISAIILSMSVYISSMAPETSIFTIVLSSIYTKGRSFRLLKAFIPFLILFALSSVLFGYHVLLSFLAFIALISAGSLIYAANLSEIGGALLYFKFPKKFVSIIYLAVSMIPLLVSDFRNVWEIHEQRGFFGYYRLLKAFISTAILRAISISESLYSKGFNYAASGVTRKPGRSDLTLLALSVLILLHSVLLGYIS